MYEIKSSHRNVNGYDVETWSREILSANILEVEVGTNGYCGGDTGHGGRTYFRLRDLGGTDIHAVATSDSYTYQEIVVTLGGDTELWTFIEALKFAVAVLEDTCRSGGGSCGSV
jgi:hypothetical protein